MKHAVQLCASDYEIKVQENCCLGFANGIVWENTKYKQEYSTVHVQKYRGHTHTHKHTYNTIPAYTHSMTTNIPLRRLGSLLA